jgi:hypothetical protein
VQVGLRQERKHTCTHTASKAIRRAHRCSGTLICVRMYACVIGRARSFALQGTDSQTRGPRLVSGVQQDNQRQTRHTKHTGTGITAVHNGYTQWGVCQTHHSMIVVCRSTQPAESTQTLPAADILLPEIQVVWVGKFSGVHRHNRTTPEGSNTATALNHPHPFQLPWNAAAKPHARSTVPTTND